MIAHLRGTVARVEANSVVVDVGGVGYRAFVPLTVLSVLPEPGGPVTLHTTMVVREDDITLYGFGSTEEQALFGVLTSVSGVGPKVALSMLSVMDAPALARAIASSDTRALTKIPGIGPKLAQRVCYELGERVAEMAFAQRVEALASTASAEENAAFEDVVEALVNLGYSRTDARKAAERAIAAAADKAHAPGLIREALSLLTRTGR